MSSYKINIVPNLPKFQKDEACRWKMDSLVVKIEGRGKNIRTCILNITSVAAQLNIPHSPQFISKYLALELGSRDEWDRKRKVATIKGVHSRETLQEKLWGFLDLFILCPNATCCLPELRHKWKSGKKGRTVCIARCMACGWEGRSLRSGHKVEKYISRNPPPKNKTAKRSESTQSSEVIIAAKKKVQQREENWDEWALGTKNPPEMEPVCMNVTSPEKPAHAGPGPGTGTRTTEQWWEDMHKNDRERQPRTPLGLFRAVLAQSDKKLIDVVSEFLRLEATHKLDQLALTRLVLDACLDFQGRGEEADGPSVEALSKSIEKNRLFLNWFTSQAHTDRMRSECDMMLMSYIENELVNRGMVKDTPQVLETLYDNYVFDAAFFVNWADKKTGYVLRDPSDLELVRNAAAPFIQWAEENTPLEETEI
jgi:translation initiation factor 2 beta subunit (eIF-2beta)/eIF-5